MIIFIREVDNVDSLSPSQEAALENLLWAYARGVHVLWMPVTLAEKLIELNCFSSYAKRALYDLKSTSMFSKNLLETEFDFRLVVSFSHRHGITLVGNELVIGYEQVLDDRFLLAPVVLTENEVDAIVYKRFSDAFFLDRKNLTSYYTVKIDPQGGGGADTIKKFTRYVNEKRPCVCFIDSDKKHPKGSNGATSQHFIGYSQGLNAGYYLEILGVHEIENLIPVKLIKILFPGHEYGLLYNAPKVKTYKRFPDHKTGFTVEEAVEQDRRHQDTFWKDFYAMKNTAKICGRFNNLVPKAREYMEHNSLFKVREVLDTELDAELYGISRVISNWGISLRRTLS